MTALIVGSNFALADIPNLKLDGALVFLTTLVFGAYAGASVAALSELTWSQVSPWGASGGYLLPFLLSAELLYVVAGLLAKKLMGGSLEGSRQNGILLGGVLGIFTFAWDVWTNLGTAVLSTSMTPGAILFVEFNPLALAFNVTHELSNLILGSVFVPATLGLLPKVGKGVLHHDLK